MLKLTPKDRKALIPYIASWWVQLLLIPGIFLAMGILPFGGGFVFGIWVFALWIPLPALTMLGLNRLTVPKCPICDSDETVKNIEIGNAEQSLFSCSKCGNFVYHY